jgi:hypothetical protein
MGYADSTGADVVSIGNIGITGTSLNVSAVQNVSADSNNSSSTNLSAANSYTFTGTSTSSLGVAGIQVSLFADQACIIKVQQSPDGTNWDLSDPYYYTASSNFGVTVQAISSYLRVVVTTMSATTTVFRLQTALCPIVEAVPRSLDPLGNLKVTLQTDRFGNPIENSTLGEMQVTKRVRLIGAQFDGNTLDTNFWNTGTSTGTVTQLNSSLSVTSGTANGHYASIWSSRRARFVTGSSNKYRAHIRLEDTGTANVKRRWGLAEVSNYTFSVSGTPNVVAGNVYTNNSQTFTVGVSGTGVSAVSMMGTGAPAAAPGTLTQVVGTGGNLSYTAFATQAIVTDGAYFELNGTTFSVVTCKGGSESRVSSGSFNGQLGYTYAPTTNNTIYEIAYGNGSVTFIIGQVPLHKVTASSANWTNSIHLNIFADATNSGNSSAVSFFVRAMNITRIGEMETAPKTYRIIGNAATYVLKYGPGRLHKVIYNNTSGTSITFYDDISANANVFGIITTAASALGSWDILADFNYGLTIKTIGNDLDATIVYE